MGEFQQDGGGRAAVISADKFGAAQRVDRIVMAHYDNDAIFCAGKFGDNVADGELPFHRVRREGIIFYLITFQVVGDVALEFPVILAANVAFAECSNFAGVLKRAFGIDVRKRSLVRSSVGAVPREQWRAECSSTG